MARTIRTMLILTVKAFLLMQIVLSTYNLTDPSLQLSINTVKKSNEHYYHVIGKVYLLTF